MAVKGLDEKSTLGPYRMQVTEAACWSFMLFLRSRMLSEDWYTWTLWIRGNTCDKSLHAQLQELSPPLLPPPPSPLHQIPAQDTRPHSLCGFQAMWHLG